MYYRSVLSTIGVLENTIKSLQEENASLKQRIVHRDRDQDVESSSEDDDDYDGIDEGSESSGDDNDDDGSQSGGDGERYVQTLVLLVIRFSVMQKCDLCSTMFTRPLSLLMYCCLQ